MISNRREFLRNLGLSTGAMWLAGRPTRGAEAGAQPKIESQGLFLADCHLPGETRAEGIIPAHPNGIQISRDRWLLLYATRGMRGTDDDRSIVYQLRRDGPLGPLVKEGFVSRAIDHWQPVEGGPKYFKQHGHPVAFGVPQGALLRGRRVAHENLFAIKWRVRGVTIDTNTGRFTDDAHRSRVAQGVEWAQVRLNDRADDIEFVQQPMPLRQCGYETGEVFCSLPRYGWMNQTYVNAVPLDADASQWTDCNHFAGERVAPLRYAYHAQRQVYEWVETGPWLFDPAGGVFEASVIGFKGEYLVATRLTGNTVSRVGKGGGLRGDCGVGWLRTGNLFQPDDATIVYAHAPASQRPRTAYRCADGRLRLFAGDATVSPTRNPRDPIYMWDIDPDAGFAPSDPRVIFEFRAAGLPLRAGQRPMIDFCKLLPPVGNRQTILYRVTMYPEGYPPAPEELAWMGIYAAELVYDRPVEAAWTFAGT